MVFNYMKNMFKKTKIGLPLVNEFSGSLLESMVEGSSNMDLSFLELGSNYIFEKDSNKLYFSGDYSVGSLKSELGGDLSNYNSVVVIPGSVEQFYSENKSIMKSSPQETFHNQKENILSEDYVNKNSFNKTYLLFSDGLVSK